jgi:hypothetical protein
LYAGPSIIHSHYRILADVRYQNQTNQLYHKTHYKSSAPPTTAQHGSGQCSNVVAVVVVVARGLTTSVVGLVGHTQQEQGRKQWRACSLMSFELLYLAHHSSSSHHHNHIITTTTTFHLCPYPTVCSCSCIMMSFIDCTRGGQAPPAAHAPRTVAGFSPYVNNGG